MASTLFAQVRAARARAANTPAVRPAGRTMILRSQAEADAAATRPGFVPTTRSTTMTNTTTPPVKLMLSCKHIVDHVGSDDPKVGEQAPCAKCKPKADGTMALRQIKLVRQPGAPVGEPLANHDELVAADMKRQADSADTAEQVIAEARQAIEADPTRITRIDVAKKAARKVRDEGGTPKQAGAVSDAIMAIAIPQAEVADRSDRSPRRQAGALTFLNLSAVRNQALLVAVGDGATVPEDEAAAAAQIAQVVQADEKRLNLDGPGVRVLLRNLGRVADDQEQPAPVRNAAGRTASWLQQHAEKADYSPV